MQLSSIQPYSSWILLLLPLLMCESVASMPRCITKVGGCQELLKHMFNMTSTTSESINHLSSETLREFDSQNDSGQKFQNKPTMTCHTASRSIPNSKRKAQRMQPLALMNVTIGILAAWKNLLYHVRNSMADLDETPYAIISKVALIDSQIKNLTDNLQVIKTILSQAPPEHKENENYGAWTGEPYIQQFQRRIHLFGLHSLFFCLHSDAQKVSDFVSILRHQILPNE